MALWQIQIFSDYLAKPYRCIVVNAAPVYAGCRQVEQQQLLKALQDWRAGFHCPLGVLHTSSTATPPRTGLFASFLRLDCRAWLAPWPVWWLLGRCTSRMLPMLGPFWVLPSGWAVLGWPLAPLPLLGPCSAVTWSSVECCAVPACIAQQLYGQHRPHASSLQTGDPCSPHPQRTHTQPQGGCEDNLGPKTPRD